MTSFTVSLTGRASELSASFFPEIVLDEEYNYSCGLLDFTTYQSIPNITSDNNQLIIYPPTPKEKPKKKQVLSQIQSPLIQNKPENIIETTPQEGHVFRVPEGSYEALDILVYLKAQLRSKGFSFEYEINRNTLKTKIKCSEAIFLSSQSVLKVFGFENQITSANEWIESENTVQISKINVLRVECNIVSGAYINGKLCHAIYEFASNKVDVGYKIIEQPTNIIYLPVVPRRISNIQIYVVDQDGNLVDFRGETVTCRIHIKRDQL